MIRSNVNRLLRVVNTLSSSRRNHLQTKSVKNLLETDAKDLNSDLLRVIGWVKSVRDQKEIKFLHLNDGSDTRALQLVVLMENLKENKQKLENLFAKLHLNTSVEVTGVLQKSNHKQQTVELHVNDMNLISECEPTTYPFKLKSKYSLEQLRQHIHLRSHNTLFASILKFRHDLTYSFHEYFYSNQFVQVHTPVLTANNCEGGCETFQAITSHDELRNEAKYFFHKPVYLTASAQLHLEAMTTSLARVYTLSPTFRAEKSMTRHHLAEFYMLEVELIDMNDLTQLLDLTENMIKQVILNTFKRFNAELFFELLNKTEPKSAQKTVKNYREFILNLAQANFARITYKEAVELINKKKPNSIKYGDDLNKEQEKFLVKCFKQTPVFVTNYPKSLKPFYMRQNEQDSDLVDNFDLLAPYVGEIVGGSLREHRYDLLVSAMKKQNLNLDNYASYLETKKFGSMKMGGFGLGLERFVQFLLNIENIKDVCAFPRSIYNCKM